MDLRKSGRAVHELAREFGVTANSIRNWMKQAELDSGTRHDGLTVPEHHSTRRTTEIKSKCRDIMSSS